LYPYGSIVIVAQLADPQGVNPKDRRCIVVTPEAATVGPEGSIRVVAISSVIPAPLPADLVPLPWQLPFHPITKLIKPSVAVCGWIAKVDISQVIDLRGKIPTKVTAKIARVLLSLEGRGE